MAELRSFIFIDQMQPQTLCYMASWMRGRLPRTNMAAQIIEVAPGLDIEPLTDVALKHADVGGGILVVERQFGYLEFHSRSTSSVKAAAQAVLDELETDESKAVKPQVLLLDEPASALDPISTAKVEELIEELSSDYCIAIVTHNMQQAARASQYTAFMYLGELVEFNRTDNIFTAPANKRTQDYVTGRFG